MLAGAPFFAACYEALGVRVRPPEEENPRWGDTSFATSLAGLAPGQQNERPVFFLPWPTAVIRDHARYVYIPTKGPAKPRKDLLNERPANGLLTNDFLNLPRERPSPPSPTRARSAPHAKATHLRRETAGQRPAPDTIPSIFPSIAL